MDSDALVKNSNGVQSVSDYADSRDRVVASDNNDHDHLSDLVSANNDKNEKLNEMSSTNQGSNADEDSEEGDDFDDDWFLKLTNSKDGPRVPPVVDANSELGE